MKFDQGHSSAYVGIGSSKLCVANSLRPKFVLMRRRGARQAVSVSCGCCLPEEIPRKRSFPLSAPPVTSVT
ncbi:hypothetical protein EJB05_19501 [Eragrostis curvula]|uniref:Uncharacterized protein n=1 Tax=Eragrostis curvula TaxID=38414 RepID=A0A5J9UWM3_9POAL|nr:hypothetical protein EJB05_19501 [Eragrostis curvula]